MPRNERIESWNKSCQNLTLNPIVSLVFTFLFMAIIVSDGGIEQEFNAIKGFKSVFLPINNDEPGVNKTRSMNWS